VEHVNFLTGIFLDQAYLAGNGHPGGVQREILAFWTHHNRRMIIASIDIPVPMAEKTHENYSLGLWA